MTQASEDIVAQAEAILAFAGIEEPRDSAATEPAPWSDSALSERVVSDVLRNRYLWTPEAGWMHWTGVIHAKTADATVMEEVRQYLRTLVAEAVRSGDGEDVRRAARVLSARTVDSVVRLARGQVLARLADFDRDPDILVTPSAVVHLPSGDRLEHDPSRLVTKCTKVSYRPGATHPCWIRALEAVPSKNHGWTQVRVGQAATGHTPDDDLVVILQGGGENGKSTVLSSAMAALGTYADMVPDNLLLASESHPTGLMTLRGLRLAVVEELPEGRHLDTQTIKKVVGTPTITGRYMRRDFVTFEASHTLMVSSNFRPEVAETDHGTWRRLALASFPYRFRKPGEPMEGPNDRPGDPDLRNRLRTDTLAQEAVLAWVVEGARAWYRSGRTMPALPRLVQDETTAWRHEQDAVLAYAAERLVPDAASVVWTTDLRDDLAEWLGGRGQRAWTDKTTAQRLGQHQWSRQHRVERVRGRHPGLTSSRPTAPGFGRPPLPGGPYWGWVGVRFRTVADDRE